MLEQTSRFQSVMLIDDSITDLYITARLIALTNFSKKVIQHSSALKALEFLQNNQTQLNELPEIILVDIYMPKMSGFEFMLEYNKLATNLKQYCKVYIVSSTIDDTDIKRVNDDENIVGFHIKPITREFLNNI